MSIDIGMVNFTFTYHYILVLLTKSSDSEQVRYQCINSSKRMLYLLDDLVADPQEPNVGIICQLLCAPFTPFLELFGEIIMPNGTNKDRLEEKKEALNAIEKLPRFLGKMRATNEFARKLERIACVFVEHANCVTQAEGMWM